MPCHVLIARAYAFARACDDKAVACHLNGDLDLRCLQSEMQLADLSSQVLKDETMKGEEYVARVVSRQNQREKYAQKLKNEEQAYQQEKMLDQ